jgi:hypothetical protein
MTYEEMQRTMQFILGQQAQFAGNQRQVGERVTRLETNMARVSEDMAGLARAHIRTSEGVARLAQVQNHMNEVMAAMPDAHRHTEEKLGAFIGVLERYISEDRRGKGGDA